MTGEDGNGRAAKPSIGKGGRKVEILHRLWVNERGQPMVLNPRIWSYAYQPKAMTGEGVAD